MKGKKTIWVEQVALNLLRIVTGFLFWQHGAQKLFGYPGGQPVGDFFGMMGSGRRSGTGGRGVARSGSLHQAGGFRPCR